MLRRKLCRRAVIVMALMAVAVCNAQAPSKLTSPIERTAAPDFTLQQADGSSLKLSDQRGKVVLLDFWATWCHGCKTEIPWYIEFQDKYKDAGLSAIGVSMDDGWSVVKPFLAEHKLNYPVVLGNDEVGKLYQISNMPVTLLIDRDGRIADWHVGMVDKAAFEGEIRSLLDEKPRHS